MPDAVKGALPKEAQTIYRKAFNGAYDGSDKTAAKTAWAAVKKAGWSKDGDGNWSKNNAVDDEAKSFAETHEFDAEIFSVGTWNGDKYGRRDLEEIAANFRTLSDRVKPPVKLGHVAKEGQPALGWVKDLKVKGKTLVATLTEVPQIVYDAIKAGLYKRVSSEIYWNYKAASDKTYKYVLKAVALLGADIPAVGDLSDLTAYLTQISTPDGSFERIASYELELEPDDAFKIKFITDHVDKEHKKMSEKKEKTYQEEYENERKAREIAEQEKADMEAELKKFKEQQEKERHEARIKEFTDTCEALVKDGKMTPAERDGLVEGVSTLTYTEDNGFLLPFETVKQFVEGRQILDTEEHGESGEEDKQEKTYTSASDELADRARKYQRDNKVTYTEATDAVLAEDPELAENYKMQDLTNE